MSIGVLQVVSDDPVTSATTTAIAMGTTQPGSTIVVYTMSNFTTVSSVTDTQGNTYTQTTAVVSASTNQHLYRHIATNIVGGANTVTATWAVSTGLRPIRVAEIGSAAASPADGQAGQSQNPPAAGADNTTSGNATSTKQPALVEGFSVAVFNTSAPTAGTGFTSETAVWGSAGSGSGARAESKRVTATGTQAATFTRTAAVEHLTIVGVLTEAGTAASVTVPTASLTAAGQPISLDQGVPWTEGALTFTGQNITLNVSGTSVSTTVPTVALTAAGQTLEMKQAMPVANAALVFTGQPITLSIGTVTQPGTVSALWGGGLVIEKNWQFLSGLGYCGAFRMKTASAGLQVQLSAIDYVYKPGGVL
jgi:hypothetical protein